MLDYRMVYFPRDAGLAPRPAEVQARTVQALHARGATRLAASFERRTGARVLTVTEVVK
jgi:hypothetical protein